MVRHGIKGAVGGGAATMAEGPIQAYQRVGAEHGPQPEARREPDDRRRILSRQDREQALRELKPLYEEHVKMFAPLGFVPGMTPEQIDAVAKRGGWDAAGVPTVEHYMKLGSWFAGTPDDLVGI